MVFMEAHSGTTIKITIRQVVLVAEEQAAEDGFVPTCLSAEPERAFIPAVPQEAEAAAAQEAEKQLLPLEQAAPRVPAPSIPVRTAPQAAADSGEETLTLPVLHPVPAMQQPGLPAEEDLLLFSQVHLPEAAQNLASGAGAAQELPQVHLIQLHLPEAVTAVAVAKAEVRRVGAEARAGEVQVVPPVVVPVADAGVKQVLFFE